MAYCTQTDLEARFGADEILRLADRDNDDVADPDVIDAAIADTDAAIDNALGAAGYATPASPVPPLLLAVACDITRYRLYDNAPTEIVVTRYEDAMAFLDRVSRGETKIADLAVTDTGVLGAHTERTRQFTDETLADYTGYL